MNRKTLDHEDGSTVETAIYGPRVGRGDESRRQQRLISSRGPQFYPAGQFVVEEFDGAGDTNAVIASRYVSHILH